MGINLKAFDLLSNSERPINLYEIARETNADIVLIDEGKTMRILQSSFYVRPLNEIYVVWGYARRNYRGCVRCYKCHTCIGQSWSASRRQVWLVSLHRIVLLHHAGDFFGTFLASFVSTCRGMVNMIQSFFADDIS